MRLYSAIFSCFVFILTFHRVLNFQPNNSRNFQGSVLGLMLLTFCVYILREQIPFQSVKYYHKCGYLQEPNFLLFLQFGTSPDLRSILPNLKSNVAEKQNISFPLTLASISSFSFIAGHIISALQTINPDLLSHRHSPQELWSH